MGELVFFVCSNTIILAMVQDFLTVSYNRQILQLSVVCGMEIIIVIAGVRVVLQRTGGRSHYYELFSSVIEIVFSRMQLS